MFPVICYLILLLVSNAESRSAPGIDIDTDTSAKTVIRCKVYVDNFTRIQMFHSSVEGDSVEKSNTRKAASVSVQAFLQGRSNNTTGSGSALCIEGFGNLEMDRNSLQLNLTTNSNKSVITMFGNTDIQVQMQGQDRLLITPISRDNHMLAGCAEYEIRVFSCEGFKDEVIISLIYEPPSPKHVNVVLRVGVFLFILELITIITHLQ